MKPFIRGYIHLSGFFIAIGACIILVYQSNKNTFISSIIYSLTLTGLYGMSGLYHCPMWSTKTYSILRRMDHAAIFALIAGTATPICLIGLRSELGIQLLIFLWVIAIFGMIITIYWTQAPKWIRAILYIATGWLIFPYLPEIKISLGSNNVWLLLLGGIIYTVGALIYAFKRPDPFPHTFGYHEIFHILVIIASGLHFAVIYSLVVNNYFHSGS